MGCNTVGFCFRIIALSTITFATCSTARSETGASDQGARIQSEVHVQRVWLDQERDISERVDSLLKEMTLEEKIGQLSQSTAVSQAAGETDKGRTERATLAADIVAGRIGSVLNESDAERLRSLQRLAVERSRLGIPLIIGRDVIHGFRTIFPIPLG